MAESLTEIYAPPSIVRGVQFDTKLIENHNNYGKKDISISAPQFKHQTFASPNELEKVRKLLTIERLEQNAEEFKFWTSDYERMMVDDWLVTRFILRGRKSSQKCGKGDSFEDTCAHTMSLIKLCAKFRQEYQISALTRENDFPVEWTKRNGLFSYKPDLAGNPVIYLRIKLHKPKLIETKELRHQFKRLLLYNLEKCDQDLMNNLGKGICCVFDMSNATFENVDLEILSWMVKSFKSYSPKLICYVIIYNLPWFFSATFKLICKTLLSNSNKQGLKFVYGDEILSFIAPGNLPPYLSESIDIRS